MKIMTCTCCGTEITAPQFFNGKPYGWTCIKKVAPAAKQVKAKFVPVELEGVFEYLTNANITDKAIAGENCGYRPMVVIRFNGKRAYVDVRNSVANHVVFQDGNVFVLEALYNEAIAKMR